MCTIQILSGIPCSGKSTYADKKFWDEINTFIVSRDNLREEMFKKPYIYTDSNEKKVTERSDYLMDLYTGIEDTTVIVDNTHCKEGYIDSIIKKYGSKCNIKVIFFDVPLWKCLFRNIVRYVTTGKYIPIKVMFNMSKNFKKINRKKYFQYT